VSRNFSILWNANDQQRVRKFLAIKLNSVSNFTSVIYFRALFNIILLYNLSFSNCSPLHSGRKLKIIFTSLENTKLCGYIKVHTLEADGGTNFMHKFFCSWHLLLLYCLCVSVYCFYVSMYCLRVSLYCLCFYVLFVCFCVLLVGFCVLFVCFCVNVYCTTVTGCQPNCSQK
jgi:hypothetical protein